MHARYQILHLLRVASDHQPMPIATETSHAHQSSFWFEKFWLGYPRSWNIVREIRRLLVQGNNRYWVMRKLELLKYRLRRWNHEEVGDTFKRLETMEAAISTLLGKRGSRG